MAKILENLHQKRPWYLRMFFYFQKKKYGHLYEPLLLWQRTPRVFLGFLHMQRAFNRKKSPLSPVLRALVTVKVSQINQCAFCIDFNASLLLKRGRPEKTIEELLNFRESSLFTESEVAALNYAEKVTLSSYSIPDQDFERLRKHFNDDAIVELTALIAFQNLSSKFNASLDAKAFGFCKASKPFK
ncbi:MAG: carboxymuconolactone decarboxylase family protein [Simkaniaceae bacterium]|nr:MAG: carboxymuconolactone decarboxylase family protein [Simkaniaceae bacterium]